MGASCDRSPAIRTTPLRFRGTPASDQRWQQSSLPLLAEKFRDRSIYTLRSSSNQLAHFPLTILVATLLGTFSTPQHGISCLRHTCVRRNGTQRNVGVLAEMGVSTSLRGGGYMPYRPSKPMRCQRAGFTLPFTRAIAQFRMTQSDALANVSFALQNILPAHKTTPPHTPSQWVAE